MYKSLGLTKNGSMNMAFRFKCITASGTFDHFHKGHEVFLKKAFETSEKVAIGITSDTFIKSKSFAHHIEPFEERRERVIQFLMTQNLFKRAKIFRLDDVYGPTLKVRAPVQGILVTKKTEEGAKEINRKRKERGLPPLKIIKVDLVKTGLGNELSSSVIRKNLVLPVSLRPLLQKPLGRLFRGTETNLQTAVFAAKNFVEKSNPSLIITVGDVVTKSFNEHRIPIDLAIVDFKIKRKETIKNLSELGFTKQNPDHIIENAPGTISPNLSEAIEKVLHQTTRHMLHAMLKTIVIRVIGEEDLAVLPTIMYARTGTLIFYGQPGEGIVCVEVDEVSKRKVTHLLSQFKN